MHRLQQVTAQYRRAEQVLAAREGQRDLLLKQKAAARTAWDHADQQLNENDLVQILLQNTSEFARRQAKERIEEIVTQALTVVFDRDYKFIVELDVKGNQPVAEYYLESGDVITQLKPPDYDRGGGVADVVSVALRLAVGELLGITGPLFMDEVGKHISQESQPNMAYFLKQYSEQFGRQIILITHNEHLAEMGDNSINITLKNGESHVKIL